MMGYGWGMGFLGWIFMGLFWVVLIGVAIWAVVALVPNTRSRGRVDAEAPEEILDRRFASGEIDAEQYRQARQELSAGRSTRR